MFFSRLAKLFFAELAKISKKSLFVSGLAKLFFAELAKKGNTLYNVMPDIVSRLSDPEVGIAEDQFRYTLLIITLHAP